MGRMVVLSTVPSGCLIRESLLSMLHGIFSPAAIMFNAVINRECLIVRDNVIDVQGLGVSQNAIVQHFFFSYSLLIEMNVLF